MRPFAQAARRIHPGSTSKSDRYRKCIALDETYMPWPLGILLFLVTVIGMEAFAYAAHRWVMHGPGWFLHASHPRKRTGAWELNDVYAAIFAVPSFVLLLGGLQWGWWPGFVWIGWGIAAYGAIYFGFHDVIVHQRIRTRYLPRSAYMRRIVQAHRLHHVVETREGNVSFGFLVAPRPEDLKAELKRRGRKGVRTSTAGQALAEK
jgi:beta-carotene 3-hydroxylase